MLAAQGGGCAICVVKDATHVDHDHVTGKVRALLCATCNTGLGMFSDNPDILSNAAGYLRRFMLFRRLVLGA